MRMLLSVVLLSLPLVAQDEKEALQARLLSVLEKTVALLGEDAESASRIASQVQVESAVGKKTPYDVYLARVEVHDARNAVRHARIELLRTKARLKRGFPPFKDIRHLLQEMLSSSEELVKHANKYKEVALVLFESGRGPFTDTIASHRLISRARVEQLKIERAMTELALEETEHGKQQGE